MSAAEPRTDVLPRPALRRVVLVLALTEVVSYGTLYYSFPVLAPLVRDDTGWAYTRLTAVFSAALLVAAVAGLGVGRLLDRVGPRPVMTAGSLLGPPALVAVALAPGFAGYLTAWLVAGLAASALLYPPAFAALTRWGGPRRTRALTALVLLAGFSSTVFAPLASVLGDALGWRGAYLVLAAVLLVVTLPAHLLGLRAPWSRPWSSPAAARGRDPEVEPDPTDEGPTDPGAAVPLALLGLAMAAVALCVFGVVITLVPMLVERGLGTGQAATALALGGVGQVLGRLGYAPLEAALGPTGRVVAVFALVALTTVALVAVPASVGLLWVASTLVGAARGLFTLVEATAVSDRFGTARFGTLNAVVTGAVVTATAAAPWLASLLGAWLGGLAPGFLVLAALAGLAVLLVPATRPGPRVSSRRRSSSPSPP